MLEEQKLTMCEGLEADTQVQLGVLVSNMTLYLLTQINTFNLDI